MNEHILFEKYPVTSVTRNNNKWRKKRFRRLRLTFVKRERENAKLEEMGITLYKKVYVLLIP